MRKSRVSQNTIELLITLFIAGTPARSSATLCGIDPNTAIQWYHRLRTIIYTHVQKEHYVFDGEIEIDERYFGGRRKGKEEGGHQEKRLYLDCINVMGVYIPACSRQEDIQWNPQAAL